jgi:quercetin dioxygenase-like cupin family protein
MKHSPEVIVMNAKTGIGALALSLAVVAPCSSTWPDEGHGPKREVVQKQDLQAPGMEGVMARVTIPPGATEGRHTHPGEVFAYVMQGTLTLAVEGKPTATLKAGDSFYIAPGVVHEGSNRGKEPVTLVGMFVVEKGKPMTTPAQ